MSYDKKIKTYSLIIQSFNSIKNVTLSAIQKKLNEKDLPDSESSINRAIKDLRSMGFEIEYDSKTRKYNLNKENNKLEERVLNYILSANFFEELMIAPKEKLAYIDFDEKVVSKGAEYLSDIFKALTQKKWIEVEYRNFRDGNLRLHKIAPMLLKEYNARWYVFGILKASNAKKKDEAYFFGLDRIFKLNITNEKVHENAFEELPVVIKLKKENNKNVKPADIFEDIMGVIFSEEKVQEIIIKIEPSQKQFVISQPWHHSQETATDEANDFRIRLFLRPNEELIYKILSFSGRAEVIEPLSLRNHIKDILQRTLHLYN